MMEWIDLSLLKEAAQLLGVGTTLGFGLSAITAALSFGILMGLKVLHKCITI